MTLSRQEIRLRIVEAFLPRAAWDGETLERELSRIESWVLSENTVPCGELATVNAGGEHADLAATSGAPPHPVGDIDGVKKTVCTSHAVDDRYHRLLGLLKTASEDNIVFKGLEDISQAIGYGPRSPNLWRVRELLDKSVKDDVCAFFRSKRQEFFYRTKKDGYGFLKLVVSLA